MDLEDLALLRRERSSRQYIYFIEAVGTNLIKIGSAADPVTRARSLGMMCPVPIKVLGATVCWQSGWREREIHKRFSADRRHGEWFVGTPDLRAYIAANADIAASLIAEMQAAAEAPAKPRGRKPRNATGPSL